MNDFLKICGEQLPGLASDPYCLSSRAASPSQISDVFLVPRLADPPADVESLAAWRLAADNTTPGGIRHIVCVGGVPVPEKFSSALPRFRGSRVRLRRYDLGFEVIDVTDDNRRMAVRFQNGRGGFRLWFATLGGRVIGGKGGIVPLSTDADLPLGAETEAVEKINFQVSWLANADAVFTGAGASGIGDGGNGNAGGSGDTGGGTTGGEAPVRVWGADSGFGQEDNEFGVGTEFGDGPAVTVWGADENNIWEFNQE